MSPVPWAYPDIRTAVSIPLFSSSSLSVSESSNVVFICCVYVCVISWTERPVNVGFSVNE